MSPTPALPPGVAFAVIELRFEPVVHLGGLSVPLQAIGLAVAILLALLLFARAARRRLGPLPSGDLAFIVLGAIPGAVVGGRLVHGLVYADAYALRPASLLDLGHGSLSLAGAVVGGAITAGYVASRLGRRVGALADAAAVPLLVAIGLGKVAMLLGGAGQGVPWNGRGAIAFLGDGPWASADPATPAEPTQLMEGAWALLGIPVVAWIGRRLDRSGRGDRGLALLAAGAWWLLGRAAVAVWWRDRAILGPWGPEGVIALVLALGCLAAIAFGSRSGTPRTPSPQPDAARAS
ncbi:MAG: prolipoprotein diacylglyceryl transferase family protein [Chloroflexota bacterium]